MRDELGLGPGAAALISGDPRARATHAIVPPGGTSRLLVPLRPGRVSAAAVRNYTTPASVRTRTVLRVASWAARLGAARLIHDVVPIGGADTFLAHVSQVLGQDLAVAVHLGPPRANRKPVLHLMDTRGRSVAFAKLGVNELTCFRVRTEAEALRQLRGVHMPGLLTPTAIASGTWRDVDYLVMKPVATWSRAKVSTRLRERATKTLVTRFPRRQTTLAEASWWLRTISDLDQCGEASEAVRLRAVADRLVQRHGDQVLVAGAAHGDWSPWNMCSHTSHLAVWDWERFSLDTPRGWDSLHFALNAHRGGAGAALAKEHVRVGEVLADLSGPEAEATALSYLVSRGVNYLLDGQHEAGARHGPVGDWLLPSLEKRVGLSATAT